MEFISTQKFIRMSPKKMRFVADVARKMKPGEAIEKLPFTGRQAAKPIINVIKTAIANAKIKGISEDGLIIKELMIGEGPRLKRGRPVSRGRWHPYKRRMSHVRVVLQTINSKDKVASESTKAVTGESTEKKEQTAKENKKTTPISKLFKRGGKAEKSAKPEKDSA
jgi:large subunit ribosomal protein L22